MFWRYSTRPGCDLLPVACVITPPTGALERFKVKTNTVYCCLFPGLWIETGYDSGHLTSKVFTFDFERNRIIRLVYIGGYIG